MSRARVWTQSYDDGTALRKCPGCGVEKLWDPRAKGGQWYGRVVQRLTEGPTGVVTMAPQLVPSAYCRECTTEKRTARRRERKAIALIAQHDPETALRMSETVWGACDVCGTQTNRRHRELAPRPAMACEVCHACLAQCGGNAAAAQSNWLSLFIHVGRENTLKREHEARVGDGRRYRWHSQQPKGMVRHAECLVAERSWRKVLAWLREVEAAGGEKGS